MWIAYQLFFYTEIGNSFVLMKVPYEFYDERLIHVHPETWFFTVYSFFKLKDDYFKDYKPKSAKIKDREMEAEYYQKIQQHFEKTKKENYNDENLRMMDTNQSIHF
jgi:hypothetical protein